MAKCASTVVHVREAYVREHHGEAGVKRLDAAASPALRVAFATGRRGEGWVDFAAFIEATTLVDKLFGKGDFALAWAVGRFGAAHNAGVAKHLFLRVLAPKTVVDIAAALWHRHYDSGHLRTRERGDHALGLELRDFAHPHRAHCMSIGGWIEATIEQKKPPGPVVVRETACRTDGAPACSWAVSWSGAAPTG